MTDRACVAFLQELLPRLGLRWPGFRKVRRQVCKRLKRRLRTLGLPDLAAYRAYLADQPDEWPVLDSLCRISISRFYRDRILFDRLGTDVLPALARTALKQKRLALHCWSIGCASGEEPYTLRLVWQMAVQPRFPGLACHILATDADPHLLARATRGCYPAGSLRELPAAWRNVAFSRNGDDFCLHPQFRESIDFQQQDIRTAVPPGHFDLILCRNLAFTYFNEATQQQTLARIVEKLEPDGVVTIGKKEQLPANGQALTLWAGQPGLYQRGADLAG